MTNYVREMRKLVGHKRILMVGAGAFIHRDGKLLLQRRLDNGCWADHGGAVELSEDVEDACRREVLEETGLTAHTLEMIGVFSGNHMDYTYPNGDEVSNVIISYLCEDFSGEPRLQADEVAELRWFALDELPDNISPPTVPMLARCVEILRERKSK